MATEHERARLAREMHDSLAKTVHGIAFAALGLARQIEREPREAVVQARKLADDARRAAHEAREILGELRGQEKAAVPLTTTLRAQAHQWSAAMVVPIAVDLEDVGVLPAVAARELEAIFKEALANIERHAQASRVSVHLRTFGERVVLTISDDGRGFEVPDNLDELAGGRHFGLKGMRERARLAGGDLSVESEPGEGCVISAWVPAQAPEPEPEPAPAVPAAPAQPSAAPTVVGQPIPPRPAPRPAPTVAAPPLPAPAAQPAEPGRPSGDPDNVPDRAVPGFTWQ
jgi:signal transduction histidine kinase